MEIERPAKSILDEGFWNGERGMASLEPGLSRFNDALERALGPAGFSPDGPMADRHGSFERQFLRDSGEGIRDVLAVALTPVSDETFISTVTPAVIRDNDFTVGETRAENVTTERVRTGEAKWISDIVSAAAELSSRSSLWKGLLNRQMKMPA